MFPGKEKSMTGEPLEDIQAGAGWATEGEFDWRHYIVVLATWWREIVVITVVTALLAGFAVVAANQLHEPEYKAWAEVAMVRTISQLNFDERFITTSGTDVRSVAANSTARRNALLGLAQGPAVAEQVAGQLGDALDAEERIPTNLAKQVEAALVSESGRAGESDLIRITATADTPDKAARIAMAWADTYVRNVNQIYGQAPDELLASILSEQAQAKTDYEQAQAALEKFIAGNRNDALSRQITEKQGVIDRIVQARADVAAAYLQTETQTRTARFERWLQVAHALDQARTLRRQVAAGGAASIGGGALVVELLKLQALTQVLDQPSQAQQETQSTSAGPVQVQVDATPLQIQLDADSALSRDELLADIDALVKALGEQRGELELQIAAPGELLANADKSAYLGHAARGADAPTEQASLSGQSNSEANAAGATSASIAIVGPDLLDSTVYDLEQAIRSLRAQLETEGARYRQLVQARDTTWDTLKTMSSKVTELALARAAGGSEVRLAAVAVPPAQPEGYGEMKVVIIGGMLGLLAGVLIALVANSFGIQRFFSRG
jgi:capsular polysaccharide biosynthesis protein